MGILVWDQPNVYAFKGIQWRALDNVAGARGKRNRNVTNVLGQGSKLGLFQFPRTGATLSLHSAFPFDVAVLLITVSIRQSSEGSTIHVAARLGESVNASSC